MTIQLYRVAVTATAEVRDKDGNLISSSPVEMVTEVPEEHLRAKGLTDDEIRQIKEQGQ